MCARRGPNKRSCVALLHSSRKWYKGNYCQLQNMAVAPKEPPLPVVGTTRVRRTPGAAMPLAMQPPQPPRTASLAIRERFLVSAVGELLSKLQCNTPPWAATLSRHQWQTAVVATPPALPWVMSHRLSHGDSCPLPTPSAHTLCPLDEVPQALPLARHCSSTSPPHA